MKHSFKMKKNVMNDLVFTNTNGELLKYNTVQYAYNVGFERLSFLMFPLIYLPSHFYNNNIYGNKESFCCSRLALGYIEQRKFKYKYMLQ